MDKHHTDIVDRAPRGSDLHKLFTGEQWLGILNAHEQRTDRIYCFLVTNLKSNTQEFVL